MYVHWYAGFIILFIFVRHEHAFPAFWAPYIPVGIALYSHFIRTLFIAQGINGLEPGSLIGRIYSEQDAYTQ